MTIEEQLKTEFKDCKDDEIVFVTVGELRELVNNGN